MILRLLFVILLFIYLFEQQHWLMLHVHIKVVAISKKMVIFPLTSSHGRPFYSCLLSDLACEWL